MIQVGANVQPPGGPLVDANARIGIDAAASSSGSLSHRRQGIAVDQSDRASPSR
jgi:hypothetical protein